MLNPCLLSTQNKMSKGNCFGNLLLLSCSSRMNISLGRNSTKNKHICSIFINLEIRRSRRLSVKCGSCLQDFLVCAAWFIYWVLSSAEDELFKRNVPFIWDLFFPLGLTTLSKTYLAKCIFVNLACLVYFWGCPRMFNHYKTF